MHHPPTPHQPVLGRRTFLVGIVASSALAACADGGSGGGASESSTPAGSDSPDPTANSTAAATTAPAGEVAEEYAGNSADLEVGTFNIIQRFPSDVQVPGEIRLPFSLSNERAAFVIDGPLELGAQVVDLDGNEIGPRILAERRDVNPAAYYAFRAQIDEPGIYGIVVDGGPAQGANFQVFERGQVAIPQPGDVLAGFDTPTIGEPAGVDPICTREPNCPFHSVTLAEALTLNQPVAYFVGTPAFCQTGSCTPALEALIEVAPDYAGDFVIVHAEVWTDLTATAIAPAVQALSMTFEPAVFITGPDGTIVERLDGLWNADELRERLDATIT